MKVLMVNKFLHPAGGAETYVFKLGEYLKSQGYEVEYFGMYHPDNIVGNRWDLYTGSVDFHKKGFLSYFTNPLKIVYSMEAKKKIGKILDVFRPDVVHINNFNYQLTPSILLAVKEYRRKYRKKVKVIYTAHDSQLVCPNHYLYRPKFRRTCEKCLNGGGFGNCIREKCIHNSFLKSCLGTLEAIYWNKRNVYENIDVIVCPSSFMKEKLDTNPVLAKKTVTMRNFVEPVVPKQEQNGKYVLYFGRYSEEKGIRTLLEVCRELPQIPFVFAGSGPLEYLMAGLDNVENVGFLKGKDLEEMIQGARFSVCPSECNENCPFSVIESMMNGTPVLGCDQGGVPELIENGYTGWLFTAGDVETLKKKIKSIWNSNEPELFRVACREKEFDTLEKYREKMCKLYL